MGRPEAEVPRDVERALLNAKRSRERAIEREAQAAAQLDLEMARAEARGVPINRIATVLGTTRATVYKGIERHRRS